MPKKTDVVPYLVSGALLMVLAWATTAGVFAGSGGGRRQSMILDFVDKELHVPCTVVVIDGEAFAVPTEEAGRVGAEIGPVRIRGGVGLLARGDLKRGQSMVMTGVRSKAKSTRHEYIGHVNVIR